MNILFIHGNYPAQFRSLASDLGKQGKHDVRYLTGRKDPEYYPLEGVNVVKYDAEKLLIEPGRSQAQTIVIEQVNLGEHIHAQVRQLIQNGFKPRLIFFHGGNGLGLFLRQAAPESILVGYFEWYFSNRCAKIMLGRSGYDANIYIHARNMITENEILACDTCVVPTEWQASQFPDKLRPFLSTIFDGVDHNFFRPGDPSIFQQAVSCKGENGQLTIYPNELLLSYATRGMEPLRGFPDFMRSLPVLLEQLPNLKVLIGGRDRSAYGMKCPSHDGSWKEMILEELPRLRNHPRITYTGLMDYHNYRLMLQRTNLHCYLTLPYVTSWSLFEALSCGSPVITNRCNATTGTLPIPNEHTVENIKDI